MKEAVVRLEPTAKTLRRLYFASGNQCAFPECKFLLVDSDGDFLAEVCHIEAASTGGQRFNSNMSNEQRRSFENLVMFCRVHHSKTNNVNLYPVEILQEIKNNHEKKIEEIIIKMTESAVRDITKSQEIIYPKSMESINIVLGWSHNQVELKETLEVMKSELEKLKKLTIEQRYVFYTMLDRSENGLILLNEVQKALKLTNHEIRNQLDILIKYNFISEPEQSGDHFGYTSDILNLDGWDMWPDIKEFCDKTNESLEEMMINLKFRILD